MNTVLVIDDDKNYREVLLEVLNLEAYIGLEAADGLIGLEMIQEHLPNLIVCDMYLPLMNGLEVLKASKTNPRSAKIPFLILTGQNDTASIQLSQNLGADAYLTKPMGMPAFLASIAQFLQPKMPPLIIENLAE